MDGLLKVSNILWFCFRSTHTPSTNTWKYVFFKTHGHKSLEFFLFEICFPLGFLI